MRFNRITKEWGCWSCEVKGKGYTTLTMMAKGISYEEAQDWVIPYVFQVSEKPPEKPPLKPVELGPLTSLPEEGFIYLEQRGYPRKFVLSKSCLWSSNTKRIVIPLSSSLWLARTTLPRHNPKYLCTEGFDRKRFVYNKERHWDEQVVGVVEGVLDSWKVELAGFPCLATLGAGISDDQLRILEHWPKLVLFPDPDHGGEMWKGKLSQLRADQLEIVPQEGITTDPGACTPELLQQLWTARRPFWDVESHLFGKDQRKNS